MLNAVGRIKLTVLPTPNVGVLSNDNDKGWLVVRDEKIMTVACGMAIIKYHAMNNTNQTVTFLALFQKHPHWKQCRDLPPRIGGRGSPSWLASVCVDDGYRMFRAKMAGSQRIERYLGHF